MNRILSMMFLGAAVAANAEPVFDDPVKAAKEDPDFLVQGEYAGEKFGLQVIAMGDHNFEAWLLAGGLPGAGWDQKTRVKFEGKADALASKDGATISIANGVATTKEMKLKKVERKSPTLSAKPPAGATVLFDGKSVDAFKDGAHMTADGLLIQGVYSKQSFGDQTLHVEFRLPYMPNARGQGRGNSGCYLQGRFEVQMLDSFGLEGKNNECGGIYSIKDCDVNMCFPPLAWQTYDVEYVAARYDDTGKKTANAHMTVRHNGVVIHKDVELPHTTTAAPVGEGKETGPLYLQDHGNPVRYRNIWLVEKK